MVLVASNSYAAVKAGSSCSKAGIKSLSAGKTYTCVKSGKKLVWDKGVVIAKAPSKPASTEVPAQSAQVSPAQEAKPTPKAPQTPTKQVFKSICDKDELVPTEWIEVQNVAAQDGCTHAYRYEPGNSNFGTPKTSETPESQLLPVDTCKVSDPKGRPYRYADFPRSKDLFTPSISAKIQVIAVQFSDLTASTSPEADYGKYFKYISDYLVNSSDNPISPSITFGSSYLQLGRNVTEYNSNGNLLNDEHGKVTQFLDDVLRVAGGSINFADIDQLAIVVPPSATPEQVKFHMNFYKSVRNGLGREVSIYLYGSTVAKSTPDHYIGYDPFIYIHEQIGHQSGLDDEYGSWGESGPNSLGQNPTLEQIGMGFWGNMSGGNLDFLAWDKWKMGFISDSQVRCVSPSLNSTVWLRPSTTKGSFVKLLVIPLSKTKAIVVESQRSTGYNFKVPTSLNGALVYQVDQELINGGAGKFGQGVHLLLPTNRKTAQWADGFFYGDARLVQNDYIEVGGFRITNVESGEFGDVVKVEKV
jgi:M6 family metalloprotease-like protein